MKHTIRLLLVLMIIGWISSCHTLSHPPIEDLIIELSAFPKGWSGDLDGPDPIDSAPLGGIKSVESTEIFFYVNGSGAYESVQRFRNSQGASDEFTRQMRLTFSETEFNTPWIVPDDLRFENSSANQMYYACSQSNGIPWLGCSYIAQYGIYFVHFSTGMVPDYMSNDDFVTVLHRIDQKMGKYADK